MATPTGYAGTTTRIIPVVWQHLGVHTAAALFTHGSAFANDVAAMPSLHAAYPMLMLLFFWRRARRSVRALLIAYVLAMAFTLVYTADHFVFDILLGWTHVGGRHYYVRQLRDMKASISIEKLRSDELTEYASACGAALAEGHARSGDPASIAAYLGSGDRFDRAIGEFAVAYADQTERDYAAYVVAIEPDGGHG